ncbi:MAG: CARDB domain-containing protein [Patescibacteria group bacterium]
MDDMENKSGNNMFDVATRALAIVGFLAIIGIGLWGTASVARGAPGVFSAIAAAIVSLTSIFVPADEEIVLSVPSLTVLSGESFTISWEHAKKNTEGSYTFRYDCADGVSFTSPSQSGAETTVFCNIPFNFLNSKDSITLTPLSTKNRFIDVTLHVDFTPNGANQPTVSGSTSLTIANENIGGSPVVTGTTPTTPVKTPTPTKGPETSGVYEIANGPVASNPNGPTDLVARIIELGVVDKTTGAFTASSTPNRSTITHRVAVRFAVENVGTRTSPQWTFNAVLPTFPSHIFSSPMQQALGPGDRIEFTIGFDSLADTNEGTLVINVDPSNRINEANKINNILTYKVITVK